ncbi:MAG: IclR family transcriptional regulator [Microbacteriaceae bacterium]
MSQSSEVSGVVPRLAAVLNGISAAGERGARLVDLAARTGIARPSVHRLLKDLIDAGMVLQTTAKTYVLGPQLYWLGLTAQAPLSNMPAIRNIVQGLARETGDTVYVAVRQQSGVRYVLRAEGDYPIRSHAVAVGDLKPFTSSYSGISLLASMPQPAIEAALQTIVVDAPEKWVAQHSLEREMRAAIADVQAQGWSYMTGVVMPGIAGMAAPVPNPDGLPLAAVSITTIESRLPRDRAERLAPALTAAASKIAEHL